MRPSPRAKTALRRRRGSTRAPEPDWIGFSAFRESFGLRLAAIPTPALFLHRATVGTKGEDRPCKPEKTASVARTARLDSRRGNDGFRRVSPVVSRPSEGP